MRVALIVGPSGVGKDTLLRQARKQLSAHGKVGFVRRYITRPPDENEDNYFVDESGFLVLESANFFVSSWQAHKNHYGISKGALRTENGRGVMICSISRSAIADFEAQYEKVSTIHITAPESILRERLLRRGRESEEKIMMRLSRARQQVVARDLVTFNNTRDIRSEGAAFVSLLERLVD